MQNLIINEIKKQILTSKIIPKPLPKSITKDKEDYISSKKLKIEIINTQKNEPQNTWIQQKNQNFQTNNDTIDFVLKTENNHILAFAQISIKGNQKNEYDSTIETLIVNPKFSRKGAGSTLIQHVCLAINSAYKNFKTENDYIQGKTLIKISPNNAIEKSFIEKLPFQKIQETTREAEKYLYEYKNKTNYILGKKIRSLRIKNGISQKELAFACGVQRTAINLIELNKRNPSIELLNSINNFICKNQLEQSELLSAAVGKILSPALHYYEPFDYSTHDYDLWIISDKITELIIKDHFQNTLEALKKGFKRYFFIPAGQGKIQGDRLLNRLKLEADITEKILKNHFKIYESPETFCDLRIFIKIETPQSINPKKEITIEGENNTRIPLPQNIAAEFFLDLQAILTELTFMADKGEKSELQGFSQYYP